MKSQNTKDLKWEFTSMNLYLRVYSSKKRVKTKKGEDVGLFNKSFNLTPQEVWPLPPAFGK